MPTSWGKQPTIRHQTEDAQALYDDEQEREPIKNQLSIGSRDEPYFFRYVYPSKDRGLRDFESKAKRGIKISTGRHLHQILSDDFIGLNEVERREVDNYIRFYPMNVSECPMNKICWAVEKIKNELKGAVSKREMLREFGSHIIVPDRVSKTIIDMSRQYKQQMKLLESLKYTGDNVYSNEDMSKRINILVEHYRKCLYELCGNRQRTFNYLTELARKDMIGEPFIWDILGDDIFELITEKERVNELVQ
jgi:hypothetical protein